MRDNILSVIQHAGLPGEIVEVETRPVGRFHFQHQRRHFANPVDQGFAAALGARFQFGEHAGFVGASAAQRSRGIVVKVGQQLALPRVPYGRANGLDVGDGENVEQAQPLQRAHKVSEFRHCPRIGNIALLRRLAHFQMVPDQPGNEFTLGLRQAKALAGAQGRLHALDLLVALALAGVVQQHRHVERPAVL